MEPSRMPAPVDAVACASLTPEGVASLTPEGVASLTPEGVASLTRFATTGVLAGVLHAAGDEPWADVVALCDRAPASFLAQLAVDSVSGRVPELPALLCAALSTRSPERLAEVFESALPTATLLQAFVRFVRSGVAGRTSLGSRPRKLVRAWLDARSDAELLAATGGSPSLADVIRLAHPRPRDPARSALYALLLGAPHRLEALSPLAQQVVRFRAGMGESPELPLAALGSPRLGEQGWTALACRASPLELAEACGSLARNGVFRVGGMASAVAARLGELRALPWRLLSALRALPGDVPGEVRAALEVALERSAHQARLPSSQVTLLADVSGSMCAPLRGAAGLRGVDAAAVLAACLPEGGEVLPFAEAPRRLRLPGSVLGAAERLASAGGGDADASAALAELARSGRPLGLVLVATDGAPDAAALRGWALLRERWPGARLVWFDLQASGESHPAPGLLCVRGFSDRALALLADLAGQAVRPFSPALPALASVG